MKLVYFDNEQEKIEDLIALCKKKGGCQNPSKRFRRKVKASKCVQSLKKTIKNLAEPFEGSGLYPMAEPSLPEPFFKFRRAKKGSVGKIQNP